MNIINSKSNEAPGQELVDFFSLDREELSLLLEERFGSTAFRADQLFQWVYQKGTTDPELMTNLSKEFRLQISDTFSFNEPKFTERRISEDGTRKYLFTTSKGDPIESVMIKQPTRMTLCVSSQVGCAMGCTFCRTGTMGLIRNLSTSDIVQQVRGVIIDAANFGDAFQSIVFMGMGEPLHNFEAVTRALRILTDDHGLAIPQRRITVSSVGLVPAIKKFGEIGYPANLAVSLNATDDDTRSTIMPINRRFKIKELLDTLRALPLTGRKRITIEYVMLSGVNDSELDLKRLPKLLRGIPSKVNLIPYNENAGLGFKTPAEKWVYTWYKTLIAGGIDTTIRWSKGSDIDAACGQLATNASKRNAGEADPISVSEDFLLKEILNRQSSSDLTAGSS